MLQPQIDTDRHQKVDEQKRRSYWGDSTASAAPELPSVPVKPDPGLARLLPRLLSRAWVSHAHRRRPAQPNPTLTGPDRLGPVFASRP